MATSTAPALSGDAPTYERHRPEQTPLYALIDEHLPRFLQRLEAEGVSLPQFVKEEFEAFLKCGRLEYGFLRVKCDACRHEKLVAFSCKRRGFCPSCGARRMVETAAHLVEHVLPEQPIRQWVLSFPYPLRFLFAARPAMLSQVLGIVYRATSTFLIRRAGLRVGAGARTGAVTLIQRFGSALNLNVHLHMLFVDGVYTFDDERPRSHRGCAPTRPELQRLLRAIAARVTRALERQGLLIRDDETASLDLEPDDGFERLLGAAVHYPITGTPTTMSIDGLFFLSVLDAPAPALRYGVPVLGYDGGKFDPERSFALMEKYRVRNGFIPPTALKLMMQVPNATTRYPVSMRSIMSAGEQVGAEVVHWADEALGVKVNEMWGQTETNYLVGNCSAVMDVRPGSMGKPYPGHVVGVIDDAGDRVADGTVGELAPRGDRGLPAEAPRGTPGRGDRRPGRAARAAHQGVHRARTRACRIRCPGRGHPAQRSDTTCGTRVSARCRVHRRAADDHDRQGAPHRAARAGG